ncbi:hypothetical protein OG266_15000 [Streptomyces sp. NBC_00554]|uniref:hypothetical protein n=1 Tax=Streptomyces sp. NBC_00554 TaxID=2903661 RepID=UPI00352D0B5A|nr:hypothetical protein OG266_15000 [Streptomyces sp. NBC_00554]
MSYAGRRCSVAARGPHPYALPADVAAAAGVPALTLAVGGDTSLPRMLSRFAELAQALGGEPARQQGELAAA